jgi:glycosyltransferase involved in cell wall biosynthesis
MNKVLSIIIPTYNMERYLEKCLSSLIIDGLERVEVIVVNDGSKDRSLDIAQSFASKYPESFVIIDKGNGN